MTLSTEEVIDEYGPALARLTASYERNRALREELLQEILLAIVSALPRLRDPSKLKPFVFRIGHNCGVRHVLSRVNDPVAITEADEVSDGSLSHEQSLLASERSEALTRAIRRLSLPYRQVITLVLEDLTHAEIAEVLGLSVVNVGVRVNRAKEQLKGLLDHDR